MFLASGTSVYYGSDKAPTSYNPVFSSHLCKGLLRLIVAHMQVSITNESLSTIRMAEGSVYEYNLVTPTEVEPGDIVGIRLPLNMEIRHSRTTKPLFLDLLSGNSSMYSYIKLDNSNPAVIPPANVVQPLQTFIPLISVRIGEFQV